MIYDDEEYERPALVDWNGTMVTREIHDLLETPYRGQTFAGSKAKAIMGFFDEVGFPG